MIIHEFIMDNEVIKCGIMATTFNELVLDILIGL